ncbi:MAG: DNA methyltransferase, partial [bacterium]
GVRYTQIFEYMFVFSKGTPKTHNLICDKPNKWAGWTNWGKKTHRGQDDELIETSDINPVPEFSPRNNIWKYITGAGYSAKDKIAHNHPAIFPDALAYDHISTWSNEGDIVYDPFTGSGTVLKLAKILNRNYIGSELVEEYEPIIEERLKSNVIANKRISYTNEEAPKPNKKRKDV